MAFRAALGSSLLRVLCFNAMLRWTLTASCVQNSHNCRGSRLSFFTAVNGRSIWQMFGIDIHAG